MYPRRRQAHAGAASIKLTHGWFVAVPHHPTRHLLFGSAGCFHCLKCPTISIRRSERSKTSSCWAPSFSGVLRALQRHQAWILLQPFQGAVATSLLQLLQCNFLAGGHVEKHHACIHGAWSWHGQVPGVCCALLWLCLLPGHSKYRPCGNC